MSDADDMAALREYVRTGSQPAFARIVRRHRGLVCAAAMRLVRDAHAAEDVAQMVFAALGRKAPFLVEREVLVSAWLVTTARFTAIDARRRIDRQRAHERWAARLKRERSRLDEAGGGTNHVTALIGDSVHRLRPKDRQIITLRYFEGLSIRELAETLGCTEEAVRQRLGRAVERLRKALATDGATLTGTTGIHKSRVVPQKPPRT
jgi:RNA polymerase sigma-70 factor (ECF subfamily)